MIELKYAQVRSYADPETAAHRIMEIANTIEADQGKVHVEKINYPMLFQEASPAEYWEGLQHANRNGMAEVSRERDFRDVHAGWCRTICLKYPPKSGRNYSLEKP